MGFEGLFELINRRHVTDIKRQIIPKDQHEKKPCHPNCCGFGEQLVTKKWMI